MPAALEGCFEPHPHDFICGLRADHSLAQGDHICIIVLPAEAGGINIPAKGATNSSDAIGDDSLSISRTAEHYAPLEFSPRHRFGYWTNEQRIIDRLFRVRSKISNAVAQLHEQSTDLFLILKSSMVRADGNFHKSLFGPSPCSRAGRQTPLQVTITFSCKRFSPICCRRPRKDHEFP